MRAEAIVNRSFGVFAGMVTWARLARMALARRRLVGELAALDDHLLRDMGVTRQDIASVMAERGLDDPTERLAARAREARRGRRAIVLEERTWAAMAKEAERSTRPGCDCPAE